VARNLGVTASFLPKPQVGINGSGMHTNISLSKQGKNIFHDPKGEAKLSSFAWTCIDRILSHAADMCLVLNSSVNAYRRLDPHYEAPNEIKVSEKDRGSMIRIPIHSEQSARIEIRSVAPDANPYMTFFVLLRVALEAEIKQKEDEKRPRVRFLPSTIQTAIQVYRQSDFMKHILGEEVHKKYVQLKSAVADRSPASLGTRVKKGEVIYHHEVHNQLLWNEF
jgi:glutamine synthetase